MRTVLTHGVFDLLHIGHIKHLEEAKRHGDKLVVSVTSDRFVNKGPGRPYFKQQQRMEVLKGLSFVDDVVLSDSELAVESIERIKPNVFVKGVDYENGESQFSDEERKALERVGAAIVFTKTQKHSSSEIINKFIWSDEQKAVIEQVKTLGGMDAIRRILAQAKQLKIAILGEAIIDEYIFVDINGVSSKKPTLSTRLLHSEQFEGGSLAVRNHLTPFVKSIYYPDCNTAKKITKTRYLHEDKHLFEVISESEIKQFETPEMYKEDLDVVILCDFGHGLFNESIRGECRASRCFVSLNCQTNSSNYGFNLFTKHDTYDYLSIDLREAKLALHDQNPSDVYGKISHMSGGEKANLSITLGKDGAIVNGVPVPAFVDSVVDPIGAGDAYFAMTSLLVKLQVDPVLVGFMGNVFAGLKTKSLGNKPVDYNHYLKTLEYILK